MPKMKTFTPASVEKLKLPTSAQRQIDYWEQSSFLGLRLSFGGARTWICQPRVLVNGKRVPVRLKIGRAGENGMPLKEARQTAKQWTDYAQDGGDPRTLKKGKEAALVEASRNTFGAVVKDFIDRHAAKLRTGADVQRTFDRYVLPYWRDKPIATIRRRDVVELLDRIEDGKVMNVRPGAGKRLLGGPVIADRTLAAIRKLFNWYAARDDEFISPVVRGMARTNPKARARKRVLSDDEIRLIWPLLGELGVYGRFIRTLFLLAQRRGEVAGMRADEIGKDRIWEIPAWRYKNGNPQFVPITDAAWTVISDGRDEDSPDLIFTTDDVTELQGWAQFRRQLDAKILESLQAAAIERGEDPEKVELPPHWVLHDLRRTAKTLMSRAGVRPDISERVLGHTITGVEGVYDRYAYVDEKRDALERLATLIERIVNPPPANVVPMIAA